MCHVVPIMVDLLDVTLVFEDSVTDTFPQTFLLYVCLDKTCAPELLKFSQMAERYLCAQCTC